MLQLQKKTNVCVCYFFASWTSYSLLVSLNRSLILILNGAHMQEQNIQCGERVCEYVIAVEYIVQCKYTYDTRLTLPIQWYCWVVVGCVHSSAHTLRARVDLGELPHFIGTSRFQMKTSVVVWMHAFATLQPNQSYRPTDTDYTLQFISPYLTNEGQFAQRGVTHSLTDFQMSYMLLAWRHEMAWRFVWR